MARLMWGTLVDIKICFSCARSVGEECTFGVLWKATCIQAFILQEGTGKLFSRMVPSMLTRHGDR